MRYGFLHPLVAILATLAIDGEPTGAPASKTEDSAPPTIRRVVIPERMGCCRAREAYFDITPLVARIRAASEGILQVTSPAPARGGVEMRISLSAPQEVRVSVFDVRGRLMRTLAEDEYPSGEHTLSWDGFDASGRRVPGGIYFVRAATPAETAVRKIVLLGG